MDEGDAWQGLFPRKKAWRLMGDVGRSTALRHEGNDADWPRPILLGPRRIAYRASDVKRWIDTRPAAKPDRDDDTGAATATAARRERIAERKAKAAAKQLAAATAATPAKSKSMSGPKGKSKPPKPKPEALAPATAREGLL